MNTYPGIYRAKNGFTRLYCSKSKYSNIDLGDFEWEEDININEHKSDTNITREYLANTKVEIESEGHEVFVRKIASSANLNCAVLNGFAFIFDNHIEDASKEIHIPLPPKEPEPKEWPQVGDEVLTASKQPAVVLAINSSEAWVRYSKQNPEENALHSYSTVAIMTLTKPLTPEEGLATLISNWRGQDKATIGDSKLAEAIINGEIKGLSYKPE